MARPWRIQFPGAAYHVMARGNDGQDIFVDDDDRLDMLGLLGRMSSRFNTEVLAFCLMTNHFHLFIRTPAANLSKAMHWLNGTYTSRFNRRRSRSGHLLQGRYKSVLVADDSYWLALSAYIHLNPVRAGLVKNPSQYEWSSFRDHSRARPRHDWLRADRTLAFFGAGATARRRYRRHVLSLAGKPESFWEEIRGAVFLGEREQWERMKREHPPSGRRDAVVEFNLRPGRAVDFKEELSLVAEVFGAPAEEILAGRRILHARPSLYYHLVEHCGMSGSRVAELTGVSEMAVSLGIKTVREKSEDDRKLRRKIKKLKHKL